MRRAPRDLLVLALAVAALCFLPRPGGAEEPEEDFDYATVGRVVARFVDGRSVVVIPVAGTLLPKLSEPIRTGNRWRLTLVIQDAKLAIGAPVRRGEGLALLSVDEVGNDVRITVEVDRLGDYGARRSEEGMILWIDAKRRTPILSPESIPASIPMTGATTMPVTVPLQSSEEPVKRARTNWVGLVGLVTLAAAAGAGVRNVRRNGWPPVLTELKDSFESALRDRLSRGRAGAATHVQPEAGQTDEQGRSVQFGREPADQRGRSAEIGDAFRVQPEKPASGIAALAATNDNDAE